MAEASRALPVLALLGMCAACAPAPPRAPAYQPRTRELTVTTVPLLVRESGRVYPFLADAFARGGVLEGKEVYGFSPSTLTVVEGDTIQLTIINPEDDEHGFVLPGCTTEDAGSFVPPDCAVRLAPLSRTHATLVARRAGIRSFVCMVTRHLPMMTGQLVILPAAAMAGSEGPDPAATPEVEGRRSDSARAGRSTSGTPTSR